MQQPRADKSIEEVVETYKDMVYGLALAHTQSRFDADDAFQQTFLAYAAKSRTFHGEEHRKAWLIRTAVNCSRKTAAGAWRRRTVPLDDVPEEAFLFERPEENEVFEAVKALPEAYRTVILLYYFEGFSTAEIGAALRVRAGTVRMRLTRGRALLKERLKGDYFDEP